jgi:hypothetical protein
MKEKINRTVDFTEADALHRFYVDSLITQSFLDMKQLMAIVEEMFIQGQRLCDVIMVCWPFCREEVGGCRGDAWS